MGTIVSRRRQDGTTAHMAKIIIKRDGAVIHRESQTFDRKPAARAWLAKREKELKQPGEIERARASRHTLADAIDKYIEDSMKELGRTKAQVLNTLRAHPIAAMECASIGSKDIVSLARDLNEDKQPQTVGNYLSHLATIFALARPAWGYPLNASAMDNAQIVARRLGLISRSRQRDRRPTLDELDQLMTFFMRRRGLPMYRITAFAIFSTRRLEEITRIEWEGFDGDRIFIRDMKHPGEKLGNDVWCDLPPEAARIIEAMPKREARIFPYNGDSISAAFTRACKILAIEDLHFHDLRHDGVSRLFEIGHSIPRAAAVSGHRSWTSLKRYTHLRQTGDKYEGWPWLDVVTARSDD